MSFDVRQGRQVTDDRRRRGSVLSLRRTRPTLWSVLVPVIALAAGLLIATTARTAQGTDLRSGQTDLPGLIRSAEAEVAADNATAAGLQKQVGAQTSRLAQGDAGTAKIRSSAQRLQQPAGLTALSGPGLSVTLDDAHPVQTLTGVDPNQLVIHQSDMQAVVNALWAGGAEAMQIMGQRVIATSAVRCVGSTLLLNGRVFSPPFTVQAIGPADQMRRTLGQSAGVELFRSAVAAYGLGYDVQNRTTITVAAYTAPIALDYAEAGR